MKFGAYKKVAALFEAELQRLGIFYSKNADATYHLVFNEKVKATILLDDLVHEWKRNPDPELVASFVRNIVGGATLTRLTWEDAQKRLRFTLKPRSELNDPHWEELGPFGYSLTTDLGLLYFCELPEIESRRWVTPDDFDDWQVSAEEMVMKASANMGELMGEARIEFVPIAGRRFAYLSVEEWTLKASLCMTSVFRRRIREEFAWPVRVVVPAIDYILIVPAEDEELLARIAQGAVNEYHDADYPLSLEILELSDKGIAVVGKLGP